MNVSLGPQVRLVALLALLAGLLALGGMFFLLRGTLLSEEVEPAPVVHRPAPVEKASPPTSKADEPVQQTPAPVEAVETPATKPAVESVKPARPAKPKLVTKNGMPVQVAAALRKHRVAVVALVVPGSDLDELTLAEARAGAKKAGVGFASVNVLPNAVGRPLAEKLGVIETPVLLVYRRPAKVFVRFDGFADRDTVAQAASSARAGR